MSLDRPEMSAAARTGGDVGRKLLYGVVTVLVFAGLVIAARGMPWGQTWRALTDAMAAARAAGATSVLAAHARYRVADLADAERAATLGRTGHGAGTPYSARRPDARRRAVSRDA